MGRALGRILVGSIVVGAVAIAGLYGWQRYAADDDDSGLISGNGRIEATEIDVAARIGGRIDEILVNEGDFVDSGDVLARMQVDSLRAQLDEARAAKAQAASSVDTAIAQVAMRESDIAAAATN
ncbi:MAG: biotin/lipoyl-binding protein [Burkholderiaceae bacterium]|nr:biotin/lipoyl-binding protein [Burkholderiaceae bacterium]